MIQKEIWTDCMWFGKTRIMGKRKEGIRKQIYIDGREFR